MTETEKRLAALEAVINATLMNIQQDLPHIYKGIKDDLEAIAMRAMGDNSQNKMDLIDVATEACRIADIDG